ncbi:granule-bound starch synthase [Tanacetum coccineum]
MGCGLYKLLRLKVVAHDDDDDDGTNHNFPLSVHKVLSNDDLLMEILLRLPILSLHLFKPVCKQWLSLITSPSFTLTRTRMSTVDPPSGLFIGRYHRPGWGSNNYDFVSFDPRIPAKRSKLFSISNSKAEIVQSCNGLLLCYIHGEYSIYNPLMSMFNMLPPIHNLNYVRYGYKEINFAFDPTKSPCYKVVHVGSVKDDNEIDYFMRIQTYSSETGVWSVSGDRFNHLWFNDFGNGIYWNGAIHWLNIHEPFHVKLDIVDHPVLKNIQIPLPLTVEGQVHRDRKLFKSHVSLLLLCKDYDCSRHLKIYEMKNEYSVWSVKYSVNLDDMMRPYPTWRMPTKWCCRDMLSIVLGERDEDSFMVIELSGNILQYKFGLETVSGLFYLGRVVLV